MQKTPWFCERQADIMLNYLPLRNVLTWGIKAMVKNKALPDSARLCQTLHLPSGHSLSLSDLALSRLVSRVFLLSRQRRSSWGYPWILLRLDPGKSSFLSYLSGFLRQPFFLFTFLFLWDGLDHCILYNVTNLHP